MIFKLVAIGDAKSVSEFYLNNSHHLRLWEPLKEDGYHELEAWKKRLEEREIEQSEGRSAYFISYNSVLCEVVAMCSLTNIVRGLSKPATWDIQFQKNIRGKG